MNFHWQNLDDGPIRKHWKYGRCWIGAYQKSVDIEWSIPSWSHCRLDFGVNGGDGHNKLTFTLALCFFYFSISIPFFRFPFGDYSEYGSSRVFLYEQREFSFYIHDYGFWWHIWSDPWGGSSRDDPWYRKTRHFDPRDFLLGRWVYSKQILDQGETVIPMPEGCYPANWQKELCTWKRPRFPFATRRIGFWFDIPQGIPCEGKGENSWDCGEDGIFGTGSSKQTLGEAIGDVTGCVLRTRERYTHRLIHRELVPVMSPRHQFVVQANGGVN